MIEIYHLNSPENDNLLARDAYFALRFGDEDVTKFSNVNGVLTATDDNGQSVFYESVATIKTDDLEDAFELSNSIFSPWFTGRHVKTSGKDGYRSSCVGDIFRTKDGQYHIVSRFGFTKIDVQA